MNFKEKLTIAQPVWSQLLKNQNLIGNTVVAGAAAGAITVSGVKSGDELSSVLDITNGVDYTSEFSIAKDGTIDNTGGTATTGATLLVSWIQWELR